MSSNERSGLCDALLEHLAPGLCIVDDEHKILCTSGSFERFFGAAREEWQGLDYRDWLTNEAHAAIDRPAAFAHDLIDAHERGEPVGPIDVHVRGSDSHEARWLEFRSSRIDSGPMAGCWIQTWSDVTHREASLRKANSRLQAMFEFGSPSVMIVDRNGCIRDLNAVGEAEMYDEYGRAANPGRPVAEILSERDRPVFERNFKRCLKGERFRVEVEMQLLGSETTEWFEMTHQPVFDESGDVEAVCVHVMGIGRQKRAQIALGQREALLRQIIDLVPHRIFAQDREGRFLLANQAMAQAYDTTVEALVDGSSGVSRPLTERDIEVIESRSGSVHEEETIDGNGHALKFATTRIPFTESASNEPAILGISIDVTDIRRAEQQQADYAQNLQAEVDVRTADLKRANRKLRELNSRFTHAERLSATEELAGSVAHSINNPLTALLGTLELELENQASPSPVLARALGLARRIENVVDRTLKLFRRGDLVLDQVRPGDVVQDVRDELVARWPERENAIEVKIGADVPDIMVDRTLLAAALTSLAENAHEAMHGEGRLFLAAELLERSGVVRFTVADTGPGVPAELRERVFEPFFTTRGGGTGLGLAIAQGVVRGLRGRIEIGDRPGGGASISVDLPAAR